MFSDRSWRGTRPVGSQLSQLPDRQELAGACHSGSLSAFFDWYNRRRPHQSLAWQTPDEAYFEALAQSQPKAA
ncbi:MAG: transposase [Comamonadaceae bacterium]|nr:transposase [Comamonadaceae bacterium]